MNKKSMRERNVYKSRISKKMQRMKMRRRRIAAMFLALCLAVTCVVSYQSLTIRASARDEKITFKYYTSITVHTGDSLWSIAEKYNNTSYYKDNKSYMKEICSINNIEDASVLRAGQRLVVPYFSTEFVK